MSFPARLKPIQSPEVVGNTTLADLTTFQIVSLTAQSLFSCRPVFQELFLGICFNSGLLSLALPTSKGDHDGADDKSAYATYLDLLVSFAQIRC